MTVLCSRCQGCPCKLGRCQSRELQVIAMRRRLHPFCQGFCQNLISSAGSAQPIGAMRRRSLHCTAGHFQGLFQVHIKQLGGGRPTPDPWTVLQVTALHSRLRSRVTAGAAPENIGPDDELPLVDAAEHDHEISQWMNPADYRKYLEDVRAVAFVHSLRAWHQQYICRLKCDCEAGGTQLWVSVLPWLRLCLPLLSTALQLTQT